MAAFRSKENLGPPPYENNVVVFHVQQNVGCLTFKY